MTVSFTAFRWHNDDGAESATTPAAAQDANLTSPLGTKILRILLQAAGDEPATAWKLQHQVNGAGGYIDTPVGASVAEAFGTVTFGAIGTMINGSSSIAVAYPTGITADQYLLLHVTTGATNNETPNTPAGWTLLATGTSTDGTFGLDTGPRRATVFGKVADGTETGTVTVTTTNGNTAGGSISRWTKTGGASWVVDAVGAGYSGNTTAVSIAFGALGWNTGDAVAFTGSQRVDTATVSARSITASGITFGAVTSRISSSITNGNDHRHIVDSVAAVTAGSGSVAATWAYTASLAASCGGVLVRLRAYTAPVTNSVYVAPSANIAAGGEATTQRLTGGTGTFTTGRRWDDENGADSIDIVNDGNTELEWAIGLQSLANGDFVDFRLTPVDTFTVTPRWTVGTGGATISPAGSVASSGVLTRQVRKAVGGSVASSGVATRQARKPLAGTVAGSGALARQARKALGGSVASSGALSVLRLLVRSLSGSVPIAGTVTRQVGKPLAGGVAAAGVLTRQTRRTLVGTVASSGVVTVTKVALRSFAGAVAISGVLGNQTRKPLAGTVSVSGVLTRRPQKPLAGSVAVSGALSAIKGAFLNLAGSVGISGAVTRSTLKPLAGVVASSGSLVRQTRRPLAGAVAISGVATITKVALRAFAGTVSISGALTRRPGKALAGAVDSSGTVVRRTGKAVAGVVALSGSVTASRLLTRAFAGTVAISGTVTRRTQKSVSGVVSTAGVVVKVARIGLVGTVDPSGALAKRVSKAFSGVVSFVGVFSGSVSSPPQSALPGRAWARFGRQDRFWIGWGQMLRPELRGSDDLRLSDEEDQ